MFCDQLKNGLSELKNCQRGSVAVVAGLALTALVLAAGIAVDYGQAASKRASMQSIADSAAIAAAREMIIANADTAQIEAVANKFVSVGTKPGNSSPTVTVSVDQQNASVEVALKEYWKPFFAPLVTDSLTPIGATAIAQIASSGKVCVVGLEDTQSRTVHLRRRATLTANGCGVYSNSTDSSSIRIDDDGALTASLICSAGGAYGTAGAYNPSPTTDCPVLPDPLSERLQPSIGLCDFTNYEATGPSVTVSPGVYCGGLLASSSTVVTFQPGVYIIKDGPLEAQASATFQGENVGFYFTGTNTEIRFSKNTRISLTAPKDGEMAGLLFFEDRSNTTEHTHRITSNDARLLLGTIYLSRGTLAVDANAPVADQSAYTAIIARKLALNEGPNLVLNSDYSATDIPIASGLSGIGGRIVLKQ